MWSAEDEYQRGRGNYSKCYSAELGMELGYPIWRKEASQRSSVSFLGSLTWVEYGFQENVFRSWKLR